MSPVIVGLAGSLSRPSKTRALVEAAAREAARLRNGTARVYDLVDLGPSVGTAHSLADLDQTAAQAVSDLLAADAIVIGSPVYKGSYAGLFKHLFDLIAPEALKGKPVLLTATGGGHRHALVIEHQLRPLFGFFEAATVPTGIYASTEDFAEGRLASTTLLSRLTDGATQLVAAIPGVMPGRSAPVAAL